MSAVDRKALIRQYKETRRPVGVFRIRNKAEDRSFVASSVDLPSAFNRHRSQLNGGVHANRELQADWNRLGPDAFEFESLDVLAPPRDKPDWDPSEDLRVLERLWLEKLAPFGPRGYNVEAKAGTRRC
jgi:hypothetical protein